MNTQTYPSYDEVRKELEEVIANFNHDARYEPRANRISRTKKNMWPFFSDQLFIIYTEVMEQLPKCASTEEWCIKMAKKFVHEG